MMKPQQAVFEYNIAEEVEKVLRQEQQQQTQQQKK